MHLKPLLLLLVIAGSASAQSVQYTASRSKGNDIQQISSLADNKFHISLFTQPGCGPCEQMKAAFASDPNLAALKNSVHFDVVDITDPNQASRCSKLNIRSTPVLVIQPPLDGRYGAPTASATIVGYKGVPKDLYNGVVIRIKEFMSRKPNPGPLADSSVAPRVSDLNENDVIRISKSSID